LRAVPFTLRSSFYAELKCARSGDALFIRHTLHSRWTVPPEIKQEKRWASRRLPQQP